MGAGGRKIGRLGNGLAAGSETTRDSDDGLGKSPTCRGVRPDCGLSADQEPVCADCLFLHEKNFEGTADVDFIRHCRAIREYVDQGISPLFSPYVAAILVGGNGRILDIDERSANHLRSSNVFGIRHNKLFAHLKKFNDLLLNAIHRVLHDCKSETLICSDSENSSARYSILLQPNNPGSAVACFIFPLGRRRIATVAQLIAMFGLSPAEARLARALCHGETLEEYADALGVKLPTVKTQLRAAFAKTQTDRQVALVNLISGIPPLR
jgi:DNA-binding CsgD family transcriptional regulator